MTTPERKTMATVVAECTCRLVERLDSDINGNGRLTENESRRIFRQLTSAISYCHLKNIVHRCVIVYNVVVVVVE